MRTLDELRKDIDTIDDEIMKLLAKRFDTVREIGKIKKEQKREPLDEQRWQSVIAKITGKAELLNMPTAVIKKIYNEIHTASLHIEKFHE